MISQAMNMPIPVVKRISFQLARKGFIAALMMAFILGISQIVWAYYLQTQINEHTIQEILTAVQKPSSQALFNNDKDWGNIILAGLVKNNFITEATIFNSQQKIFVSNKTYSHSDNTYRIITQLVAKEYTQNSISLFHINNDHLGTLQLTVDHHVLLAPLYHRALLTFILSLFLVLIVWGIMLAVFQRIITEPMALIIQSFRSIDPRMMDNAQLKPLNGHENDELGLLVTIANNFIRANAYHVAERVDAEKKLLQLNEGLEKRVKERTDRLSQKIIQHERAEKQLRMYEKIVSATSDMIALIDTNYRYILVNASYVNAFGKQKDELISKTVEELFGEEMYAQLQPKLNRCFKGETTVFETWYNYPQTGLRYMSVQYAPWVQDGTIEHVVVSGRDITRLKRAEEQLVMARADAENANKAKSEFLARMSHEIRTPMNAIIGLTHLVMQTNLTDKQYDYLYKITTSSQSLLSIINDILDFSKIEAGKLTIESVAFQLDDVLEKLSNILSIKAHKKGLELIFSIHPDVPQILVGDPLRLGQVLTNLTNNAIKFTDHGEIIIRIIRQKSSDQDKLSLLFSVIDTGIGMNDAQMNTLFKSFSQADRYITRKYGGTGLGLAICKGLVKIMDGEISVKSIPGKGSTFSFTSSFGWKPANLLLKDQPMNIQNVHILLVDDNKASRIIFNKTLSSFSFQVTEAGSGKEAIQLLESPDAPSFSLILMDWKMPELDGIESTRRIKALKNINKIPAILMVTAYSDDDIIHAAKSAGIESVLTKPINPSELFDNIMSVLGKNKIQPLLKKKYRSRHYQQRYDLTGNILLVEDNDINQEVAEELLRLAGFHVDIAANGKEALDMYIHHSDRYDAILMDIQMPEMDGYEATRLIRQHESDKQFLNNVPIIAMTAHAMTGEKKRCLTAGMNDYTTKPIDPDILIQTLCRWLPHLDASITKPLEKKEALKNTAFKSSSSLLNRPDGLARVSYQEQTYLKILTSFVRDFSDCAVRIKTAYEQKLYADAQNLIHTLKGVSGNLGAKAVHENCYQLEKKIKETDGTNIIAHIQQLEKILAETITEIERLIQDHSMTKTPDIALESKLSEKISDDYQKIRTLITRFDRLLQQQNLDAETVYNSLKELLRDTIYIKDLSIIETHMSQFDYSQARSQLLHLEKTIQKNNIQQETSDGPGRSEK
ncbi:MAG: response regulator [Candidatus Magnetomorum sp.]|nr:response regulator [Candidatus Magnetomorum sp.]